MIKNKYLVKFINQKIKQEIKRFINNKLKKNKRKIKHYWVRVWGLMIEKE